MIVSDFSVRPLAAEDIPDVAGLERSVFSHPWTAGDLEKSLTDPYTHFFVGVNEEATYGYIGLRFGTDTADILTLCVDEKYRRCGIAAALLETAIRFVRENKLDPLFLEVRASNVSARALYEKYGFSVLSIRKKYYRDPVEDAVIMRKEIANENSCH